MTNDALFKNPSLYKIQAMKIAAWIRSLPEDWRGIILTTSFTKIRNLQDILKLQLGDRLLIPDTNWKVRSRVESFLEDKRKGVVVVDTIQGWGHGLDLRGDLARFVIVAGVPHVNPFDPYEIARKKRPNGQKYAWWLAYNAVTQAAGRVSRGERKDDGEYLENYCALADGSTTAPMAFKYYSDWFSEAIK
jgi:Rad3-related DNA helicase